MPSNYLTEQIEGDSVEAFFILAAKAINTLTTLGGVL